MQRTPPFTTLQLSLLGPWEARTDQGELPPLPTRHTRTLLARLALAHPQPISRAQLCRELFPESLPSNANRHLRVTLHYLRQVLGDSVVTNADTLALDHRLTITHDLGQFQSLTGPEATPTMLRTALALYRGPLLERPTRGWAAQQAELLHEQSIALLRRLLVLAQASQQLAEESELARRWVDADPWNEEAHLALLRALVARGWRREAERQLQRSRARLQAEWDAEAGSAFEERARVVFGASPKARPDRPEQSLAGEPTSARLTQPCADPSRRCPDTQNNCDDTHTDCTTTVRMLIRAAEQSAALLRGKVAVYLNDHLHRSRQCLERNMQAAAELHLSAAAELAKQLGQPDVVSAVDVALKLLLECVNLGNVLQVKPQLSCGGGAEQTETAARRRALLRAAQVSCEPGVGLRVLRLLGQAHLDNLQLCAGLELLRESAALAQTQHSGTELHHSQMILANALLQHNQLAEGSALAEGLLAAVHGREPSALAALLTANLARANLRLGNSEHAAALATESWQMAEALGAPQQAAYALSIAAEISARGGLLEQAQTLIERAMAWLELHAPQSDLPVAHIAARISLARGQIEQARQLATQALAQVKPCGRWAFLGPEALVTAAEVLGATDGPAVTRPIQMRAYQYLLEQLAGVACPARRRAYLNSTPVFARLIAASSGPRRLALLPSSSAPTTRPLREDELVPVIWTLHDVGSLSTTPGGRRQQIVRLASEAAEQGAAPAVEALAEILAVSPRTILLDLQAIRSAGLDIRTRGSRQRNHAVAA